MMQTKPDNVRGEVPLKILWKWTVVSTLLHAVLIGLLSGFSYWGHSKKEAASKAKAAVEEAALKKKEADEAAKSANAPPVAVTNAVTAAPAAEASNRVASAEKILGIDKVAKTNEILKSPFSSKGDDLLKDLK